MNVGDDPDQRIAELERELAQQKRINELQTQLAGARATANEPVFSVNEPAFYQQTSRPSRSLTGMNLFGAIAGVIGFCAGGGSALTAMLPSTALWTSRIICGGPNQLMINTSHYSYKPNQSGTTVDFECLKADGVYDANWIAITALQSLLLTLVFAGVAAVVLVLRRRSRQEPVSQTQVVLASGLGVLAAAVVVFLASQAIAGASRPTQMPPGGNLSVDGNAQTKNIACNDGNLSVDGREMTVNVTGHCAKISVDGVINHVTVDSVDAIDVDGIHNVVTYHSGSPKVTQRNNQNTVQQG